MHITRVYSRRRAYLVPCRAPAGMRGSRRQPWNCMDTGTSPGSGPAGAGDPLFPVLVADYFIANARGPLTPLQVIKMAYIAHGYSLAILGEPLVDEAVEAWRYGPVLPSVYYAAKRYGGDGITRLLYSGTRTDDGEGVEGARKFFRSRIPPRQRAVLDGVLDVYGGFNGRQLTNMTHVAGSPWDQYYCEHEKYRHVEVCGERVPALGIPAPAT